MEELRGAAAGNTGYNHTRGVVGHTHTQVEYTHMPADVKGILQGWTRGSKKHHGLNEGAAGVVVGL